MPIKLTKEQIEKELQENNCKLISNYINSKTHITILCKCNHKRITRITEYRKYNQYLCKDCTSNKKITTNFTNLINKFSKLYLNILNNRDNFNPLIINNKQKCIRCKNIKSLFLFSNDNKTLNGKFSVCKNCSYKSKKLSRYNNQDTMIKVMLKSCKINNKKRSNNRDNMIFDIDENYIKYIILKQKNKCIYSGRELEWKIGSIDKPSIDRIDSNKGYIKGNIQLVTKYTNIMKSDLSEYEFKLLINDIYKNMS